MSKFLFKCPHCGVKLVTADSDIGKQALCPACGKKLRIELQTNPDPCFAPKISVQSTAPKNIESNTSTYEPENCGWSNFLTVMGTLHLVCAGILFLIGTSQPNYIYIGVAVSVAISSIPSFLSAWIVQQIYISNDLKRKQIELLIKIYNKK